MSTMTEPVVEAMALDRADEVAVLIFSVVSALPYYNERARHEELSKYRACDLREMVDHEPHAVLTADLNETLAGFCISKYDDGLLWLAWFGVAEGFRRRGIGAALLARLEKTLPERNAHKIWCDTRTDNIGSQRVLRRAGYVQIGHLVNHWYGQDFYLWEKYPSPRDAFAEP